MAVWATSGLFLILIFGLRLAPTALACNSHQWLSRLLGSNTTTTGTTNSSMPGKDKFLYFAYGSNLLTERIRINNPSAQFHAVGRLPDHQLDFNYFSRRWRGAAATILPQPGSNVWGVLWQLDTEHQLTLDKQEGVPNIYNR